MKAKREDMLYDVLRSVDSDFGKTRPGVPKRKRATLGPAHFIHFCLERLSSVPSGVRCYWDDHKFEAIFLCESVMEQ